VPDRARRAADPAGVADRDDRITGTDVARGAERSDVQAGGAACLQHGEVIGAVDPDDDRRVGPAVAEVGHDRGRPGDDVVIGDDHTGRGQDDAGASRPGALGPVDGVDIHEAGVDGPGDRGRRASRRRAGRARRTQDRRPDDRGLDGGEQVESDQQDGCSHHDGREITPAAWGW
jgi:hypothetical protein